MHNKVEYNNPIPIYHIRNPISRAQGKKKPRGLGEWGRTGYLNVGWKKNYFFKPLTMASPSRACS